MHIERKGFQLLRHGCRARQMHGHALRAVQVAELACDAFDNGECNAAELIVALILALIGLATLKLR